MSTYQFKENELVSIKSHLNKMDTENNEWVAFLDKGNPLQKKDLSFFKEPSDAFEHASKHSAGLNVLSVRTTKEVLSRVNEQIELATNCSKIQTVARDHQHSVQDTMRYLKGVKH